MMQDFKTPQRKQQPNIFLGLRECSGKQFNQVLKLTSAHTKVVSATTEGMGINPHKLCISYFYKIFQGVHKRKSKTTLNMPVWHISSKKSTSK
jgi:hypothetical protein